MISYHKEKRYVYLNINERDLIGKRFRKLLGAYFNVVPVSKWFRKNLYTTGYEIAACYYGISWEEKVGYAIALRYALRDIYGIKELKKEFGHVCLTYNQMHKLYNLMKLKGEIK